MEGKELYNEDDDQNQKPVNDDDTDSFGLPEIEGADDKDKDPEDTFNKDWKENQEEEQPIFSSASDDYSAKDESYSSDYSYEERIEPSEEKHNEYKSPSYYEETYGQKKSPVGWIIALVLFILIVAAGAIWYFMQDKKEPPVQTQVVQPQEPEPEPEPEPVKPKEPEKVAGVYELDQPNGRYHVIVASSVDKDLVRDYAFKLAKKNMACYILAPRGNKKFHRLSVADYQTVNEAALKADQLKGEFGSDVWVIRY